MHCDMNRNCIEPVTHIGERGYVYCETHGRQRRHYGVERTRKMAAWELKLIAAGKPLPSYTRIRKPSDL